MHRRELLKRFIYLSFGTITLLFTTIAAFVFPKGHREKSLVFIPVMEAHLLPKKYVKRVDYHYEQEGQKYNGRIYIAISEGRFIALSPVCTHLGCLVNWDSINKEFICPCHAGRYNQQGLVIEGPPVLPLKRMPIEIREEMVYVGIYL